MHEQNNRLDSLGYQLTYCGYWIKRAASKLRARLFALCARPFLMRGGYKLKRHDGVVIYRIENLRMNPVAEARNSSDGKKCFRKDKPRRVVVIKLDGINVFAIFQSAASFSWLNFVLNNHPFLDVLPLANAILFDGRIYPGFSNESFWIFEAVRCGLNPNIVKLLGLPHQKRWSTTPPLRAGLARMLRQRES